MDILLLPFFVFLELIKWMIFIEIILSWISLLGLHIAIPFFSVVLIPIFERTRKIFPTALGPLDFTPVILLIAIYVIQSLIVQIVPSILLRIPSFSFL